MRNLVFTLLLAFSCSFSILFAQNKEIDSLKRVLPTYTESDTNHINTLNELAFKYQGINPDTMLVLAERGIFLAQKSKYDKGEVEALRNKGIAFNLKGDYAQALKLYFEALPLAEKIGYKKGIGGLYNNIALVYYNQGKNSEALENYLKALKISEEIGYKRGTALSLNNIALVYEKQGKHTEALKNFFKSLKISEEIGYKKGIALSLENIALVYEKQGKYTEALENYSKTLKISEEIGYKQGIAETKNGLAKVYLALKNYEPALKYAQQGLDIAKEIGDKKQIRDIDETLSKIYKTTGRYELALLHYEQFKIYADSLNNFEIEKKTANLQAQYEFDKKTALIQVEQAKKDIEQDIQKKQLYWLMLSAFAGLFSVLVILFLIFRSRKKIQNAYSQLEISNNQVQQAKEEIEVQSQELQQSNNALNLAYIEIHQRNEDITASINYAKRIQTAILPFDDRFKQSFDEENFFILFKPKDIVSGDFYWFEETQTLTETIKFITVADCTGHGVAGAFMSMIGNQLLHEIIIKNQIYSPDLILNQLHKEVHRALRQKETNTNDGMDMVMIVIRSNPQGFKIEYAGAMNPLYYVQNGEFKEIKATKKAIGGEQSEEERFFEKHEIQIENNEPISLYLCTDGYQDQFGGEGNRKFMVKKLRELLFGINEIPMHKQDRMLDDTFENWKEDYEQTDDVTIVGIRL